MTDKTNPRADLDAALVAMRDTGGSRAENADRITLAAVVACAEALSLLVDALAPMPPEPDPRESLPDETPVGHGWVTALEDSDLFKPNSNGQFTWWLDNVSEWANSGNWEEWNLYDARPATVGDLRRVGLPITEWPDITASEPEPVEPPVGSVALDRDGISRQRHEDGGWVGARTINCLTWAELHRKYSPVTVIHRAEES